MEMASGSYVLAVLSMMDQKEGFERLLRALREIDREIQHKFANAAPDWQKKDRCTRRELSLDSTKLRLETKLNIWEAYTAPWEELELTQAAGRISAGFINLYPPGIPLAAPGEVFNEQVVRMISDYTDCGYPVQGINGKRVKAVKIF